MKSKKDLLIDLQTELGDLHGNIVRLMDFRESEDFNKINLNHQILLLTQLKAMIEYENALDQRINLIKE